MSFYPWELAVRNAAASVCKAITPRGLLSLVLTDPQWDAYGANQIFDQAGHAVIAPRFVPPAHIEVNDTMNSVTLYIAKASNDNLLEWINGEEALKTAIVESLGKVVTQVTQSPIDGFTLMSIMEIMNKVRAKYGRMEKHTRNQLKERMTARLTSTEAFDAHISNLTSLYSISEIGGFPISQEKQVDIFRASVFGHPLIAAALQSYGFEHTDSRTHTFAAITTYVTDNLPNLREATRVETAANANIMTSEVYLTLEAENKKLKDAQANPKKRSGGKGKGKNKKQKGNRSGDTKQGKSDKSAKQTKYCWVHGTQHTHSSNECKLMAGNETQFSPAMRHAKDADHPPGGSIKVLGQEPK